MKIKAKKAFVSGRWSASKGGTLDVPAARASRLIAMELAEPVKTDTGNKKGKKNAQTSADSKEPPKGQEKE